MKKKFELREWLQSIKFPENFNFGNETYTVLDIDINKQLTTIRNGAEGFTIKVKNEYKAIHALKFVEKNHKSQLIEIELATRLQRKRNTFIIPQHYEEEIKINDKVFSCFVLDWVYGCTLGEIIRQRPNKITAEFSKECLIQTLTAIAFLYRKGLKHDDLHLNNIMLEDPDPDAIVGNETPPLEIKIIDTGCMRELQKPSPKHYDKDDLYYFIRLAVELRNTLFNNRRLYVNSIDFVKQLDEFIYKLQDDDYSRAWGENEVSNQNSTLDIFTIIMSHLRDINISNNENQNKIHMLTQPFEAMSAEYLSDNQLVIDLFIKNNTWYNEVASREPTILTGPRGCGKSMVFRYLSANTHLQKLSENNFDALENIGFLGIYINCSHDIQAYLSWMHNKVSSSNNEDYTFFKNGVITFFSLLICSKLILTLHRISLNKFALKKYQTSKENIEKFCNYVFNRANMTDVPVLSGTTKILDLHNRLEIKKFKVHQALLNRESKNAKANVGLPMILDEAFILDISSNCYENLNKSHPVVYLLDDYTFGRVPKNIQKILNVLIWQRTYFQHFKISSEKLSVTTINSYGINADKNREYEEIDTGNDSFLDKNNKQFITDMLNTRFENANWKGRVDTLIGKSNDTTYMALKNSIINAHKAGSGGHYALYYGIDIISHLWTGDTATILQLVKRITKNTNSETTEVIKKDVQDKAISEISKIYLENIKSFHPYGAELKSICDAFGNFMRNNLLIPRINSNDSEPKYYNIPRIEFSLTEGKELLPMLKEKNKKAHDIAYELLRRTIFIDRNQGIDKEKNNTVRWDFKKIYYPANKVSFGKDHYLDIKNIDEFIEFLTNTKNYLDRKFQNTKTINTNYNQNIFKDI